MKISIPKRFKTVRELGEKYLQEHLGIEPDYVTIGVGIQDDGVTWAALLQYEADGISHPEFVDLDKKDFEGTEHAHKMLILGEGKTLSQALISLEDLLLKLLSIHIIDEYEEEFKKDEERYKAELELELVKQGWSPKTINTVSNKIFTITPIINGSSSS